MDKSTGGIRRSWIISKEEFLSRAEILHVISPVLLRMVSVNSTDVNESKISD